jgi:hypothetical protein
MDEMSMILDAGQTAVFIFLYYKERRRVSELADARILDHKRWIDMLITIIRHFPDTPKFGPDL